MKRIIESKPELLGKSYINSRMEKSGNLCSPSAAHLKFDWMAVTLLMGAEWWGGVWWGGGERVCVGLTEKEMF